jgi:hypothetical protein
MKKTNFVNKLNLVYNDILDIKVDVDVTFDELLNRFYDLMHKWKICQGTHTDHGSIIISNAEWIMCFQIFVMHKNKTYDSYLLFHKLENKENEKDEKQYSEKDLNLINGDILKIKIKNEDSFQTSLNKFNGVMNKYNIILNSTMWDMCYHVFKSYNMSYIDIWQALSTPPKDLVAYDK